jgi:hypothetical protein
MAEAIFHASLIHSCSCFPHISRCQSLGLGYIALCNILLTPAPLRAIFLQSVILRAHCCLSHVPDPDDLQNTRSSRLVSKTRDPSVIHIPSNRLEVTVHTETAYEEYPMSQMKHYGSYHDKPRNISIDDNVKGREGKTA